MFWLWVGLVILVVLALAAWSTHRARRVHGNRSVADDGTVTGPRVTPGEVDAANSQAKSRTFRLGGGF